MGHRAALGLPYRGCYAYALLVSDSSQPAFPSGLKEIVNETKIVWPGWEVFLGRDNEDTGYPVLHIVSDTWDSYDTTKRMRVNHSFLVPMASYNARVWEAWIMERLCDVFRHEAGEILLIDGVRKFAPHHGNGEDPYITWYVGDLADTRVKAGNPK